MRNISRRAPRMMLLGPLVGARIGERCIRSPAYFYMQEKKAAIRSLIRMSGQVNRHGKHGRQIWRSYIEFMNRTIDDSLASCHQNRELIPIPNAVRTHRLYKALPGSRFKFAHSELLHVSRDLVPNFSPPPIQLSAMDPSIMKLLEEDEVSLSLHLSLPLSLPWNRNLSSGSSLVCGFLDVVWSTRSWYDPWDWQDESMHSGADVEAFTAALNRDISGGAPSTAEPPDSNAGICGTPIECLILYL